ncbi:MAG: M23 family metallopeptidase, partial [Bacteroidota bacterium]
NVRYNQKVKKGDVIAWVGNTGRSIAPHLHYEVHHNGEPVNPIYYCFGGVTPREFDRIIEVSERSNQTFD